jgi:hypothetical protein
MITAQTDRLLRVGIDAIPVPKEWPASPPSSWNDLPNGSALVLKRISSIPAGGSAVAAYLSQYLQREAYALPAVWRAMEVPLISIRNSVGSSHALSGSLCGYEK